MGSGGPGPLTGQKVGHALAVTWKRDTIFFRWDDGMVWIEMVKFKISLMLDDVFIKNIIYIIIYI